MIAQLPNLDTILKRHEIPPKFWPEMHGLVEDGHRPCRTAGNPPEPRPQIQGGLERDSGGTLEAAGTQVSAGRLPIAGVV